jgi:hypothetical protein
MICSADDEIDINLRDLLLFDMAGCAVLTLLINATTSPALIDKLGILKEH